MSLAPSHLPPPPAKRPLDATLRDYFDTNSDIVTRITKPVNMVNIGALSAQSDQPILFENIVEKPGFRLCDILVKNRRSQARALGVPEQDYLKTLAFRLRQAAARHQEGQDRAGEGSGAHRQRCRLDRRCRSRCTRTRITGRMSRP